MEIPNVRDVLTKNVKKDRVIEALTSEYECVNYVVVSSSKEKEASIRYRISKLFADIIPGWMNDISIYERFDLIKNNIVVESEREAFAQKLSREVILEHLEKSPVYLFNFTALVKGEKHYYQVKCVADMKKEKLAGFIVAILCIDAEARAEQKSRELQNVINAMTEDFDTIIYYNFDTSGSIIYRAGRFLAQARKDLGRNVGLGNMLLYYAERLVLPEDKANFIQQIQREKLLSVVRSGIPYTVQTRIGDPANPKWMGLKFVRHRIHGGENSILVGFRNITNEITSELKHKADLEVQNKALESARDAAQAASKAKSTFLFNMSHDIRTPMNAVLGFADKIEKYIDNPEVVKDSVSKLKSSGKLLLSIINEVLELSRIESGKLEIDEIPVDVTTAITWLEDVVKPLLEKKQLHFALEMNVRDKFVYMDSPHVNKILFNIISNAIKYTPACGHIWCKFEQMSDLPDGRTLYRWSVRDDGIGMDAKFVEHAFERFSREHSSTVSGIEGTGLGLAVCREFVEKMGGAINIDSAKDAGTTVSFSLPFRKCKECDFPKKSDAVVVKDSVRLDGKKVLLVDDNEMNREIAADLLADNGMIVDTADNGLKAVEKVATSKPGDIDVVLMDIQMPVMDGYEATKRIRALPNKDLANVPIIAMTANAFEEDRKAALAAGMNAHLAKPVDPDLLCRTMSQYV